MLAGSAPETWNALVRSGVLYWIPLTTATKNLYRIRRGWRKRSCHGDGEVRWFWFAR